MVFPSGDKLIASIYSGFASGPTPVDSSTQNITKINKRYTQGPGFYVTGEDEVGRPTYTQVLSGFAGLTVAEQNVPKSKNTRGRCGVWRAEH